MKSILIVDYEYDITSTLEIVLGLEGYGVRTAFNGQEALASLEVAPPDLIISDVMMPVLDGYGLVRALHAKPAYRAIPIILMSAVDVDKRRLEPGSRTTFIRKPFDVDRLLARVAAALSGAADGGRK